MILAGAKSWRERELRQARAAGLREAAALVGGRIRPGETPLDQWRLLWELAEEIKSLADDLDLARRPRPA